MTIYDRIEATGEHVPAAVEELGRGLEGVAFPPSYVAFVTRFGYGLTCGLYLIYPPLGDYPDSVFEQAQGIKWALLAVLHPDDPDYDWQYEPDGSKELIPRLVAFGRSENGHALFWDTGSVDARGEFPIYVSTRGSGIRFAGVDLEDFLARAAHPLTFKAARRTYLDAWRRGER